MAKAMGLNTIAIYVFWNAHEREEGKYDFHTGPRDIGKFLGIAREEGMWINLRPGPYCCGERDLGGIPTYLLRYPDIKFRTIRDARYQRAVANYFHELAKVVRPQMAANGGPILIVQIENEYGQLSRGGTTITWSGSATNGARKACKALSTRPTGPARATSRGSSFRAWPSDLTRAPTRASSPWPGG